MSDSSSFTFSLPNDTLFYFNIDLKLSAIILFVIVLSIFMTSITSLFVSPRRYEMFSNDEFYSYKNINYSNYSRVPLTSNNNLTFGTASRIITTNQDTNNVFYNMNIDANLYVLGGNVYDDTSYQKTYVKQDYIAQLVNPKTNKILPLGSLGKDTDGLYKLKYSFNVNKLPETIKTIDELNDYNIVQVLYVTRDLKTNNINKSKVMISGDLKSLQ